MNKTLLSFLKNYQNSKDLYSLLIKYNLDNTIIKAIVSINGKLNGNEFKELPKISGIILNDINGIISKIRNDNEKKKIEYLLSDIFQDYIKNIRGQYLVTYNF